LLDRLGVQFREARLAESLRLLTQVSRQTVVVTEGPVRASKKVQGKNPEKSCQSLDGAHEKNLFQTT
jgi:hypothetical protein